MTMRQLISTDDTLHGALRFEGTRIGVAHIVREMELGATDTELVTVFDLTVAELDLARAWAEENRWQSYGSRRTG